LFCASCGGPIAADDKSCQQCGSALLGPGSIRFTSSTEHPQSLDEVFAPTAAVQRTVEPVGDREPAFEPLPDEELFDDQPSEGPDDDQPPAEWFNDPVATRTVPRNPPKRDRLRLVPTPDPDGTRPRRTLTAFAMGICLLLALGVAGSVRWAMAIIDAPFADARAMASQPARTPSPKPTPSPRQLPPPPASPAPTPTEQATGYRASSLPAAAKQCSALVAANQQTSCGFAQAVAKALPKNPKGRFTVSATSPSSGQTSTLQCSADAMVICQGRTARVYILY